MNSRGYCFLSSSARLVRGDINKILNVNTDDVIVQRDVMNMNSNRELEARLKQHFIEVLSINVDLQLWPGERTLPAFLRQTYAFQAARILGVPCLFLIDRGVQPNTPAAIKKHLFEVGKRWEGEVVYVAAGIDSARRKQLIDQTVPFIVPGNQIYLPMLGIDLREHFRSVRRVAESLSPATQAAFLRVLHTHESGPFSPQEMAAQLGYTSMTLSRAFDELESAGIGRHYTTGRRRLMELAGPRRDQWEKAMPLLRSPVVRRVQAPVPKDVANAPAAGLTALAFYTNLAEPRIPVIAFDGTAWRSFRNKAVYSYIGGMDSPTTEVEVWSYPPKSVANGPVVDRLSLYLSLRGTTDERVETALNELLESMKW